MISLTSPVETRAHSWPAWAKLGGLCAATVGLFFIQSLLVHSLIFAGVVAAYLSVGAAFFKAGLRHMRILWPFLVVLAVWHIWTGEKVAGAVIILRLMSAVGLANLVTMTTRLSDMMEVVRTLTAPLARVGLRPAALEMAIALVIRITPVLAQKGTQLTESWRARSPRKLRWNILLPFTVLALDDAEYVADALRARGGINPHEDS